MDLFQFAPTIRQDIIAAVYEAEQCNFDVLDANITGKSGNVFVTSRIYWKYWHIFIGDLELGTIPK